jgi:hypothetical protein
VIEGLGVGELTLGGLEDAGAVLVAALVRAGLRGALVVTVGEDGPHIGGGQLVVAGPRLVAAEGGAPTGAGCSPPPEYGPRQAPRGRARGPSPRLPGAIAA